MTFRFRRHHRPVKEYDSLTGQYLDSAWLAEREGMVVEATRNWDQQEGDCLNCDLPMRLHPPGRLLALRSQLEQFCRVARQRNEENE